MPSFPLNLPTSLANSHLQLFLNRNLAWGPQAFRLASVLSHIRFPKLP